MQKFNVNLFGGRDGEIGGYLFEESFSKKDIKEFKELVENLNNDVTYIGMFYGETLYSIEVTFEDKVTMIIHNENETIINFEYDLHIFEEYIPRPGLGMNPFLTIFFLLTRDFDDYELFNQLFLFFVAILYYKEKLWSKNCLHDKFVRVSSVGELIDEFERVPPEKSVYVGNDGTPFTYLDNKGVHFYSYLKAIDMQTKKIKKFNTIEDLVNILKNVPRDTKVSSGVDDKVYLCSKSNSDNLYIYDNPCYLYENIESEN